MQISDLLLFNSLFWLPPSKLEASPMCFFFMALQSLHMNLGISHASPPSSVSLFCGLLASGGKEWCLCLCFP